MKDSDSDSNSNDSYMKLGSLLGVFIAPVLVQHLLSSYYSKSDAVFVAALVGVAALLFLDSKLRPTYLLDFACYRPPNHLKISRADFIDLARQSGAFTDSSIELMSKALASSGIGDQSYLPSVVFRAGHTISLSDGREEAAAAMFGAIDAVLASTKVRPKDVGILVVNCGVLNTTPSLASMVINHYKLKKNVQSFNLGGMGCSAGVVAVEVAKDLLKVHRAVTYALVVSTEAVSSAWYKGGDPDKLIPNCYLRMGAAAALLSSAHRHRWRAKYRLCSLRRTISASTALRVAEDSEGTLGVSVGPDIVKALMSSLSLMPARPEFEHACVGAMGKEVLEAVQSELGMSDKQMEASRKTLERFGNTSSSSIWYELAYLERGGKVKAGDRVWQIAFGSGIKCNTLLWEALRHNNKVPTHSPWD